MTVTVNVPGSNFRTFADNSGTWGVLDVVDEPIGNEASGVAYLVDTLGLGEFEGKSNNIAILTANEGWYFIEPTVGKLVFDADNGLTYRWNGTAWVEFSGGGGSSGGLADRSVSASSSAPELNITADDAGGTVFVDGANGAFDVFFDPGLLPGMTVFVKRKDSVDNVNPINVNGLSGVSKGLFTADKDWGFFKSHSGGTAVVLLAGNVT